MTPMDNAIIVQHLERFQKQLDSIQSMVQPLILDRSGDLARAAAIEADIRSSHDKHREMWAWRTETEKRVFRLEENHKDYALLKAAVDKLQAQLNRATWIVIGAFGVAQLLLPRFLDKIFALFGG